MTPPLAIGVDLGATKIATALVDRGGAVLASRQTLTLPGDGPGAVCGRIAAEVRALLAAAPRAVAGIGIGSPGIVDARSGVVRNAVNLGWTEVLLAVEIRRRTGGIPTFAENDANANALGEGYFGSATGSRDYVLLTLGSGLGSGVVSSGRLVGGANAMAADLGHYSLDPDNGLPCACGHRGCAETVASGPGLVAVARGVLDSEHASSLAGSADLSPDQVLAAARVGDPAARAALAAMARAVGEVAAVAVTVTNPDTVVIGGGLGVAAFDLIRAGAEHALRRRVPPTLEGGVRLVCASLRSPAVGAASLVFSASRSGE